MYLVRVRSRGRIRHVIRQSFEDPQGNWRFRDVFDLGPDPSHYVVYTGPRGFYFEWAIEEALSDLGIAYTQDDLEHLFWPFLRPDIRRVISQFGRRGPRGRGHRSEDELRTIRDSLHAFDLRRAAFLRFGQMNLDPIIAEPLPIYDFLCQKSRDEIEQTFAELERDLKAAEWRRYLYAVFGVVRGLSPVQLRLAADGLIPEASDEAFLEAVCRLDRDPLFLDAGAAPKRSGGPHAYLRRYLIIYFDEAFCRPGPIGAGHRRSQAGWTPPVRPEAGETEHLRTFGLSAAVFARMDAKALTRLYRRKAQRLHPDKGGDHEAFLTLTAAYQFLILRKP